MVLLLILNVDRQDLKLLNYMFHLFVWVDFQNIEYLFCVFVVCVTVSDVISDESRATAEEAVRG